jgi:dTDP-glucose 4,6-dehydratase
MPRRRPGRTTRARLFHTHGLPVVTNCTNNYGPYRSREADPDPILSALRAAAASGRGPTRDWLYVEDHAAALERVAEAGEPADLLHGGRAERTTRTWRAVRRA